DPQALQGDAARAFAEARDCGVRIEPWRADATLQGVLVDALLGTGISGEVREPYAGAIAAINESGLPVLAIDLPSGLCANTGRVLGQAVRAELSVTFIGLKLGLFTGEGPDRVGARVFDDLQADPQVVAQVESEAVRLDRPSLARVAPRSPVAHKGGFGQVLVIGGDLGTGGAALLSAEAA
ncbi:NAD(P)H-hydrate epimerase, partial [Pseudomonas lopnurensis]|uniref:NAD(P)H-hydrate epimerase n=1 Tax=Pseudomonas lopnurensis TaxID=1477517 RepID=UPI0028B0A9BF